VLADGLGARQFITGCNLDGRDQRAVDRTLFGENLVHPIDRFPCRFGSRHLQQDVNAPDDQRSVLVLDFSPRVGLDLSTVYFNLARCQRAGKCAEQSTGSGRDNVIQRGCV